MCVRERERKGGREGRRRGAEVQKIDTSRSRDGQTERLQSHIFPLSLPFPPSLHLPSPLSQYGHPLPLPQTHLRTIPYTHTEGRSLHKTGWPGRRASGAWSFTIPKSDISHERLNEPALGSIRGRCSLTLTKQTIPNPQSRRHQFVQRWLWWLSCFSALSDDLDCSQCPRDVSPGPLSRTHYPSFFV